jgi:hypothetical protein
MSLQFISEAAGSDIMNRLADSFARLGGMGLAETADLVAGSTRTVITIAMGESPDAPQQSHGQQSLIRESMGAIVSDTRPAVGNQVVISQGRHAGTWTILGIDRADAAVVVVKLRMAAVTATRSPAAREVLR